MLILLVSVTSWTTELALKALDAEIDAAEKAVDSTFRSPPVRCTGRRAAGRRAAATPEDGNNLLASLNECQQKHFGLGKMSEECTQAIQNAIQSKVGAVGRGACRGHGELVEEARTEALKSPDCGKSYQKPWWPPSKDDPLSAQDPPIFKNKRVTGTAKTLKWSRRASGSATTSLRHCRDHHAESQGHQRGTRARIPRKLSRPRCRTNTQSLMSTPIRRSQRRVGSPRKRS